MGFKESALGEAEKGARHPLTGHQCCSQGFSLTGTVVLVRPPRPRQLLQRKHLTGAMLTVPEGESRIVLVGGRQAWC